MCVCLCRRVYYISWEYKVLRRNIHKKKKLASKQKAYSLNLLFLLLLFYWTAELSIWIFCLYFPLLHSCTCQAVSWPQGNSHLGQTDLCSNTEEVFYNQRGEPLDSIREFWTVITKSIILSAMQQYEPFCEITVKLDDKSERHVATKVKFRHQND